MITTENYVDEAEKAILSLLELKDMRGKPIAPVSTSKIRNLLAMSADIYNQVMNVTEDELDEDIVSRIEYLRIRFIYEAGRDKSVKNLVDKSKILDVLTEIKGSKKNFILFNRYMESLVAFRKYYCEKDD